MGVEALPQDEEHRRREPGGHGNGQDPGHNDGFSDTPSYGRKAPHAPDAMTAPVMVWVVLTGMPAMEAPIMDIAAAVSALNPPLGCSLVILLPMVLTILQPPAIVPRAITR